MGENANVPGGGGSAGRTAVQTPTTGAAASEATGARGGGASAQAPPERQRTMEKPDTGTKETGVKEAPKKVPPQSSWWGMDTYPDGYTMGKAPDGDIWLSGEGWSAYWDAVKEAWVDAETGDQMPSDWGGGHRPGGSQSQGDVTPQS